MTSGGDADLLIEQRDAVAWITLNRPNKANALTITMQDRLLQFLQDAAANETIAAVVLTGAGLKTFCGGADYAEAIGLPANERAELRSKTFFDCCFSLVEFPKPIVTAINGHACGSGFMLAMLTDARVAALEASLSLPEITRGQPTFAGCSLLGQMLGDVAASDLVLSGRRMSALEAKARGIVFDAVSLSDLSQMANDIASRLGRHSARAFALNKKWIYRGYRELLEDAARESTRARVALQDATLS